MKSVQISEELFYKICDCFLRPPEDNQEFLELCDDIAAGLKVKLEAIHRRNLYSLVAKSKTDADREAARLAYLDAIGMHASFRSPTPPGPAPEDPV